MIYRLSILFSLACLSSMLLASASNAAVAYDESVSGDLSSTYSQPTQVPLTLGTNSVIASMGQFDSGMDLDYLRIDLPAGTKLTGILLEKFESQDETAFIGVQAGTAFTFDSNQAFSNVGNLLGWTHFGPGNGDGIGQDLLPHLGQGQGAIGFTGPLAGPSYTFWIQQTGQPTNYQLDFVVAPEPSALILALVGIPLVALARYAR